MDAASAQEGGARNPGSRRKWGVGVLGALVVGVPIVIWLNVMRPSPFPVPQNIDGVPLIPGRASALYTREGSTPPPRDSLYEVYGDDAGPQYVLVALHEPSDAGQRLAEELEGMEGLVTPDASSLVARTTADGQHVACEAVDLVGTTGQDILCGWDDPALEISGSVVGFGASLDATMAFTLAAVTAIRDQG